MVRASTDTRLLDGLEVELCHGDLTDHESLRQAVRGCRRVFHCAADYRLWTRDPSQLYVANVQGTHQLFEACLAQGVEKVVYTSSVATIGIPADGTPGDEETRVGRQHMIGHYKRSKYDAEQVAFHFARRGLPIVIVNPSTPVGPGDAKPTATGRIITDFLTGRMPAYVDTGLNLVAVEDVAEGHLLAEQRGVNGRHYILGNQNLSLRQILELLGELTGRAAPRVRIPQLVAELIGHLDTFVRGKLFGVEPRVPIEGVKMARKKMYFDSARAATELGFEPTPVREALARAVDWFGSQGYV